MPPVPVISGSSSRFLKEVLLMCGLSRLPAGKTGVSSPHHTPICPQPCHSTVWKEWPKGYWQTPIISLAAHRGADNQTTAHRPGGGGTLPITGAMEGVSVPSSRESCAVLFPPTDYCSGCKIQDRDRRQMIPTLTGSLFSNIPSYSKMGTLKPMRITVIHEWLDG